MQETQQKINELLKKAKEEQDKAQPGSHDAQQGILHTIANYWQWIIVTLKCYTTGCVAMCNDLFMYLLIYRSWYGSCQ